MPETYQALSLNYLVMNKIALVTGAYKGLGFEWCRQLGNDGFTIILTARNFEKAEKGAEKLREEGLNVIPKALDVSKENEIEKLAKEVEKEFGQLDILINNAGINSKDSGNNALFMKSFRLSDLDAEEVLRHIRINSIAPIIMVKHFRNLLKKSKNSIIVSVSSWLGSITIKDFGGHYSYATSKAALNMMNKAMALELKEEGIISVVINPGWVQTDMGGSKAPLTPKQSVRGIIDNVINKINITATGKFFQWDGTEHAW